MDPRCHEHEGIDDYYQIIWCAVEFIVDVVQRGRRKRRRGEHNEKEEEEAKEEEEEG